MIKVTEKGGRTIDNWNAQERGRHVGHRGLTSQDYYGIAEERLACVNSRVPNVDGGTSGGMRELAPTTYGRK